MRAALAAAICSATIAPPALAQQAEEPDATIVVTAPGDLLERDSEAEGVDAQAVRGVGRPDLLQALSRQVPALSLQDAQGNPFQPNLVYRGFTASPLQGQAQGLAVYVDGVRFNQPFGDTVQFDLLPQAAVARADLLDANPIYGLNALGGALVVETKTGRSAPGEFISVSLGAYGEGQASAEAGWRRGTTSAYVALQASHDDGWRRYSPSTVYNGFADIGWDGDSAGVHLKLSGADTDLTGNGSAPVELLQADYRAVFTHPDTTRNRYGRISVHPWVGVGDRTRLLATLYYQHLTQSTLNGDAADIGSCDDGTGRLCLTSAVGDEEQLLMDTNGKTINDTPGSERYGVLNHSRTRSPSAGVLAQLEDRRPLGGRENVLVAGFSFDRSQTLFDASAEVGELTDDRGVEGLGSLIAQPDGSITPISVAARTRYIGLFASDHLPLSSNLTAELALRWNQAAIGLAGSVVGDHGYERVNPGIQLDWRIPPKVTLRVGYSEANRAPTPAELACADATAPCSLTNFFVADPALKQVVARTFEAGGQGQIGKLQWLISAFRSTSNDDIQFVASDTRGRAFFRNIGKSRRQGVEATLVYRTEGLTVRAGYAFTDATFRTSLLLNSPDNPAADTNGQISVAPGDRLPGIPRHRGLLATDYQAKGWTLGGNLQAASGQVLFGDEANLQPPTKTYLLVDVHGTVRLHGPLQLFGEVRNVLDTKYATYGTLSETSSVPLAEAPGASNPRSLGPGATRRWTIGVKANL